MGNCWNCGRENEGAICYSCGFEVIHEEMIHGVNCGCDPSYCPAGEEDEEVEAPEQFESREEAIEHAREHGRAIDIWEAENVE